MLGNWKMAETGAEGHKKILVEKAGSGDLGMAGNGKAVPAEMMSPLEWGGRTVPVSALSALGEETGAGSNSALH